MDTNNRPPDESGAEVAVDISKISNNMSFIRCASFIADMICKYGGEIEISDKEINK